MNGFEIAESVIIPKLEDVGLIYKRRVPFTDQDVYVYLFEGIGRLIDKQTSYLSVCITKYDIDKNKCNLEEFLDYKTDLAIKTYENYVHDYLCKTPS